MYGKPDIANNFDSVKQDWCKDLHVHQILEIDGKIKNGLSMPEGKRPLDMELRALRNAVED